MSDDVLVVGGGFAGSVAALSASNADPGASIRVLAAGREFDTQTGLLDLLGYEPTQRELVAKPLAAIEELPSWHQYSQLGAANVREALSLFDDVTGDRYAGRHADENAVFPTATGRLMPAARYPAALASGAVSRDAPMRLIGFERIADFDAELAADRLDDQVPFEVTGSTVETTLAVSSPPVGVEMARRLDTDAEDGIVLRELIETLRPELDTEPRIGLPAVLGIEEHARIRRALSDALHADVFEIPVGPPSVTGRRLETLLRDELAARNITVERGVDVTDFEASQGRIDRVVGTGEQTERYEADTIVLATGGVGAGGLVGTGGEIVEPLFDCAVSVPKRKEGLTASEFLGNHPAVRAGVETEGLRPLDGTGEVRFENLYAAGRILEDSNALAERSAGGLALVSGSEAGRLAVQ